MNEDPMKNSYDFWNSVIASVLSFGSMEFSKAGPDGLRVPGPGESGLFRKSVGERKGQLADWRATVPGSRRGVHVVEFPEHYSVHVDRFDPGKDPIRHLLMDSPKTFASIIGAGLASLFLYSLLRKKK